MDLATALAKNIKEKRGNLSQVQFAKKLGIGRSTLNRIENAEQNVTIKTLDQLRKALKCDIEDLFNDSCS